MSFDTYVCSCCGYLVIFRNWGGKKHQPFHLPTGWPCWRMVQEGECSAPESLPIPISEQEEESDRSELVEQALELYRRYRRTGQLVALRDLVISQLSAGRTGAALAVVEEIFYRFPNDRQMRAFVGQVVSSAEWMALADQARAAQ